MQALRRAVSGTKANSRALNFSSVHQQGSVPCAVHALAIAQPLGAQHRGQRQGSTDSVCIMG